MLKEDLQKKKIRKLYKKIKKILFKLYFDLFIFIKKKKFIRLG